MAPLKLGQSYSDGFVQGCAFVHAARRSKKPDDSYWYMDDVCVRYAWVYFYHAVEKSEGTHALQAREHVRYRAFLPEHWRLAKPRTERGLRQSPLGITSSLSRANQ